MRAGLLLPSLDTACWCPSILTRVSSVLYSLSSSSSLQLWRVMHQSSLFPKYVDFMIFFLLDFPIKILFLNRRYFFFLTFFSDVSHHFRRRTFIVFVLGGMEHYGFIYQGW